MATEYITNPDEVSYPSYDVLIRNNATGEERTCHMSYPWGESSEFWWTEGNMACDCNRFLQFENSVVPRPSSCDPNSICGTSRYTAIEAIFPDGKKYKIDADLNGR